MQKLPQPLCNVVLEALIVNLVLHGAVVRLTVPDWNLASQSVSMAILGLRPEVQMVLHSRETGHKTDQKFGLHNDTKTLNFQW